MQKVLVVDHDPRSRLGWLNALRDEFELDVVPRGVIPVRSVRTFRPSAVVLSITRGRTQEILRWSRTIKTDSASPPVVVIFDPAGRIREPRRAMETSMADGFIRGDATGPQRQEMMAGLMRGERELYVESPLKSWRGWLPRRG